MKLLALLDRPSSLSMGMLPLVLEEEGLLFVSGFGARKLIREEVLADLLAMNQALRTEPVQVQVLENMAALWIGREFTRQAGALGLHVPEVQGVAVSLHEGSAHLLAAREVYEHLDQFMNQAFKACAKSSSHAIAVLMCQVLPSDERTWCALWHSAPPLERLRELNWYVRMGRDAGTPRDPEEVVARFTELWQEAILS